MKSRTTTKEQLNIGSLELNLLGKKDLSRIVSNLSSVANKRVGRLRAAGLSSSALATVKDAGRFGAKGKSLNELRSEYMRVRRFLEAKSSTVTGARQVQADFFERVGEDEPESVSQDDLQRFWNTYNSLPASTRFIMGSDILQKMLYQVVEDNPLSDTGELLALFDEELMEEYEALEAETDEWEWFEV